MDSRILLSTLLVLMVALVGTSLATTTVNQGETLVISSDHTDTDFVVKGTMILEGDANAVFTGRSVIDGERDFENEEGAEIIMNGGSFLLAGDDDDVRLDMGRGAPGDAYLIINDGYFQISGDGGAMRDGYLLLGDDPGGVHRVFVNGGTLRVRAMIIEPARDCHVYVGGGTMIVEDISGVNNAYTLSGWLTDYNNPDGLAVMLPAEGYEEVIVVPFIEGPITGEMAYAIRGPEAAFPEPSNEAENICPDGLVLNWMPGAQTQPTDGHEVYFGTDFNDVNDATTSTLLIYKGSQDSNEYPEVGSLSLDLDTTYYWRIDEVNDSDPNRWKGPVWSFTTNDGNAFDPEPTDNASRVPLETDLSWQPGCFFVSHNVYFSTDYNEVANRQGGAFLGNIPSSTIDPCEGGDLEYFTRYYWAVDEVGSPTYQGPVWNFRTRAEVQDPNLIIQYKFDETAGSIANDWSGNEFNGDVDGVDVDTWDSDDGQYGGSINMDGGQRVDVPMGAVGLIGDKEVSVSLWFKGASNPVETNWIFSLHAGVGLEEWNLKAAIPDSIGGVRFVAGYHPEDEPEEEDSNDVLQWTEDEGAAPGAWEPEWHHFVFMKNENAGTMSIYFDGVLVEQRSDVYIGTLAVLKPIAQRFVVGAHAYHAGWFLAVENTYNGKIDDFRLYDYALSDGEVELIYRGGNLGLAWAPYPYHGRRDLQREMVLSWRAGAYATHHDVYLGTAYDDVNDATTNDSVYKPPRLAIGTETYDPGDLELNTTYYWRIDEVNTIDPNLWKGNIWEFTVAEYIIIDDFESYGHTNDLILKWVNPIWNGAGVELGKFASSPVHSGGQSMVYNYLIHDWYWYYAEVEYTYDDPCDWTEAEIKSLGLFFYGDFDNDGNSLEQMYLGLEDSATDRYDINYPDMNDINKEEWQEWYLDLTKFDTNGVDQDAIKKIYLGFGDPDVGVATNGGVVFFDDIRLYSTKCVPEFGPTADISGDCIVSFPDIVILGDDWLETDKVLTTSEPQDTPVGEWKLDEDMGSLAGDTGSGGNNGTLQGSYLWVAGHDGSAVEFYNGRVLVPDAAVLRPQYEVTTCAWIKYPTQTGYSRVVVKGADNWETYILMVSPSNELIFNINEDTPGPNDPNTYAISDESALYTDDWAHIAGTYDGTLMKIFVNGEVVDTSADANGITLSQDPNGLAIGGRPESIANSFVGIIDEVRVYDVALTEAEIAYIALGPTGYMPLQSEANLYDEEAQTYKAINFRDYAVLMNSWLEEQLWP